MAGAQLARLNAVYVFLWHESLSPFG